MNLANRITIARFFLTVGFVISLSSDLPYSKSAGLLLFILAGVSDYIDGEIARRCGMITDFGKLMDPLVDKIMMAAAFICLVPLKLIPAWVVIIIISREFLITGLRLLALTKGRMLAAESLGKHKTIWQIITVLYFLLLLAAQEWRLTVRLESTSWWSLAQPAIAVGLISCALALTLWSGLSYLWKNRSVIDAS
jgi:CDP-diacylglycerol---glycerol-3-phosphate 3-phosphatidyltransferase